MCDACATHEVDGAPSCAACAKTAMVRSESMGGLVIMTMAAAYVAMLAFATRGGGSVSRLLGTGVAAVLTIALGRGLLMAFRVPSHVQPRGADEARR